MTQEEKSLTPEEVRLALQEYIDAEEEEDYEEEYSFSPLIFKAQNPDPDSSSLLASSNFLLPWSREAEASQILFFHPSVMEIVKVIFNKKSNLDYNKHHVVINQKIFKDFLVEKNFISSKTSFYVRGMGLILSYLYKNKLLTAFVYEKGYTVLTFSSFVSVLKPSVKKESLSEILKATPIPLQEDFFSEALMLCSDAKSSSLSVVTKENCNNILNSLEGFLKSYRPNSLTTLIRVDHFYSFCKSLKLEADKAPVCLNQLVSKKTLFFWDVVKEKEENFYYIVFYPQIEKDLVFFVHFYVLSRRGVFLSDEDCFIDLSCLASLLGSSPSKIHEALQELEKRSFISIMEIHPQTKNLIKIKLIHN